MDILRLLNEHPDMRSSSQRPLGALSVAAWALTALADALLAAAVATGVVAAIVQLWVLVPLAASATATAGLGALVVTRRPQTRSGWLLIGLGLSMAITLSTRQFAFFTGVYHEGDLAITQALIAVSDATFSPVVLFLALLFLTFPDGRLPSPRWRPLVGLLVVLLSLAVAIDLLTAWYIVDPAAYLADISTMGGEGLEAGRLVVGLYYVVGALVLIVLLLSAASLVVRLRRARGEERQQIKWVVYAGVASLLLFPADAVQSPSPLIWNIQLLLGGLSFLPVVGGFGVALFRYRLWEIDLVVRRSLVYGALWLAIAGIYGGLAAGLGLAAGRRFPVELAIGLSVLATLAFQPARRSLERLADRWVFGRRDSPLEAMHGFGELLGSAERRGDIASQLAETAVAAVGLAWVEVELDGSVPARLGAPNGESPTVIAIARRDEQLGQLVCRPRPGQKLTAQDQALLAALASQAGLAASHARLASRIVQAQESERRRIERNIHDGAQQELVALVAQLGLARTQANGDGSSGAVLRRVQREVRQILANLRELAQGIHPSVLSDGGLVAAVEDRCSRLPVTVSLDVALTLRSRRLSDDVESAAYFFVAEALTNVLKHSQSASVAGGLAFDGSVLTVDVADAGIGFDPGAVRGSGLSGLADRIHALGGEISIESRPGAGARLTATLPLAAVPVERS